MKQKTFSILLTLLMCMVANVTLAYDAEIDGIYYDFSGTEATVTFGDNKYTGDIVIPETVTYDETVYSVVAIGGDAFWNCYSRLTSITIPSSVTSIGSGAFGYCIGLTSITIPNSVTTIGYGSFQGCSGLTEIVVEEGNTIYDSRNNCNALIETSSNILITGCQNTIIPNSVTSIGYQAFHDCTGLTSITIPSSVTTIEAYAFYGCINLTSVKIPGSVTSIGDRAFSGCGGLTVIAVEEENTNYDSRNNCNAIIETSSNTLITGCKNTTIPNSVISIGDYAFTDCNDLITIPGSVMNIGYHAFACKGLTAFTVDDDNVSFASEDGVLFNKAKTVLLQYPMAKNETTYAIPSSVKRIEGDSFLGCSGLSSITIPNSVTSIGYYAFGGCFGLTSIMIPNSVTSIESYAFGYCNSLTSVTIPNSVTCIEDVVFFGCSSLTSVTIPSSVTSIGDRAFGDCNSLIDLYCYTKNVPTTHPDAYAYTPISNITLHVPIASIEAYKMTEPWSGFKEIVVCNDVDVENQSIKAGNSTSMDIDVSNYDTNLVGFQMDITLPEGIGIDKTGCTLSDRITDENQKLTIGKLESGAYRITSTSLSLKPISGNDGTLLSLKLTAEDGCIGGEAILSNIIFSTVESEKVVMSDKTFDISILYDLTYKVDGQVYKDTSVVYGTAITPLEEPTKEGYTFGGWSEIPETMPNHDVEIMGNFTINKYLLTYMVDGEIVKSDSIEFNTAIAPLEEPAKEGYTFSGWSEIPETMPAHDVTITGTFTINKYLLTYMVDGEVFKSDSIVYNTVLTPEAEPFKEGYTFSGWSEIPETMPAHDVTITGTFTINKYLLTYMVDGEIVKSDSIEFNTAITPLEEPTKEGYTFTGWSEIPETMPSRDVEITGNFYLYGDVNTDEEVDVVDVVDIARFVVATPSANFREKLADLNFDKTVNIADAVTLVNFIAGDQNFSRMMISSRESYDYDLCQLLLLSNGSNALSLCLDGAADFTAFQFEVELPENTDITAMSINGQRMDDHEILYNKVEANRYRVAVLSLSNAIFKGNAGELLNISIDGLNTNEVSVQNIHFVTKNGKDITFDALALSGIVTGIANVRADESDNVIFDLQGRKLSKTQRGVNIVDGKKVIVK